MLKRAFDLLVSAVGLAILSPLFLVVGLLIKFDSLGPVFYRQLRVGRYGIPFRIHKFRTMATDAESIGLQLTTRNDARITRVGTILRKWKIDELPQLIDVFLGSMSLVGPRPEVPRYVEHYPDGIKRLIFSVRPGLTDLASIKYKDENTLLQSAIDAEKVYVNEILPIKLRFYADYVMHRSFFGDLRVICTTVLKVFFGKKNSRDKES